MRHLPAHTHIGLACGVTSLSGGGAGQAPRLCSMQCSITNMQEPTAQGSALPPQSCRTNLWLPASYRLMKPAPCYLGGGDLRPGSDQPSKGKASGVERNREADSCWRDGPRPKRVLKNIMCTLSPGTYWQLVGTKRMAALQTRHDEGR